MYGSVLVANRGEIAVRIFRTLRRLGIEAIAVYSDADRDALHVRLADRAVRLGPEAASESYLAVDRVLDAVAVTGAEAVHPGYGFLSENAGFARAVVGAGAVWIGPPAEAIEAMGDKIRAKEMMVAAGVPVVPGSDGYGLSDDELMAAAVRVGLPVLIKPSAGGGGKGMHRVTDVDALAAVIAAARREARSAFGVDTLLVERWIPRPRHLEVQVFADMHGGVVSLGERECSLQRRHQKIIEETPSPLLDAAARTRLEASAVEAARACGYVGAGTVEFVVSAEKPDEHYFLEMNTRLQVEHPITEAVTGFDLVEAQLRVAAGEPLPFGNSAKRIGHAFEARVCAEDPGRGFLPVAGTVLSYAEPTGAGVRVDSSLSSATVVGAVYDSLLAKVIAWGADRDEARRRLIRALTNFEVLGVTTNAGFLADLLAHPSVVAGDLDTELVERELPALIARPASPDRDGAPDRDEAPDGGEVPDGDEVLDRREVAAAAAMLWALEAEPSPALADPWDIPGGWRLGAPAETVFEWTVDGAAVEVGIFGRADAARVRIDGAQPRALAATWGESVAEGSASHGDLVVADDGGVATWAWARSGDEVWLGRHGRSWVVRPGGGLSSVAESVQAGEVWVVSPMPGTVLAVLVADGDLVSAGQPVALIEAMKMEHTVRAPRAGVVEGLVVAAGAVVRRDQRIAAVVAPPAEK